MWHVGGTGEFQTGFWWGAEGKRPLGRPRPRRADNVKIYIQLVGWEGGGMYRILLAKYRDGWQALGNEMTNLWESKNSQEFLE